MIGIVRYFIFDRPNEGHELKNIEKMRWFYAWVDLYQFQEGRTKKKRFSEDFVSPFVFIS